MECEPKPSLKKSKTIDVVDSSPYEGGSGLNSRVKHLVRSPTQANTDDDFVMIEKNVNGTQGKLKEKTKSINCDEAIKVNDIIIINDMEEDLNLFNKLGIQNQNEIRKSQSEINKEDDKNYEIFDQIFQASILASNIPKECRHLVKVSSPAQIYSNDNIKSEESLVFEDGSKITDSALKFNIYSYSTPNLCNEYDMITPNFVQNSSNVIPQQQNTNILQKRTLADEFFDDLFK